MDVEIEMGNVDLYCEPRSGKKLSRSAREEALVKTLMDVHTLVESAQKQDEKFQKRAGIVRERMKNKPRNQRSQFKKNGKRKLYRDEKALILANVKLEEQMGTAVFMGVDHLCLVGTVFRGAASKLSNS
ncbi:MAG: hypothetical protein GY822_06155 [Deltaproteobacteria bacterium]|nr:hypothetical protein [Deltaproteobacteria bacterium]